MRRSLAQDMPSLILDSGGILESTTATPPDKVGWDATMTTNPSAAAAINRGCPVGYFAESTPNGMVCRLLASTTPATMQAESAGPETWSQTIAAHTSALGDIGASLAQIPAAFADIGKSLLWIAGGVGALMLLNRARKL